jgi:hypothetical protein
MRRVIIAQTASSAKSKNNKGAIIGQLPNDRALS